MNKLLERALADARKLALNMTDEPCMENWAAQTPSHDDERGFAVEKTLRGARRKGWIFETLPDAPLRRCASSL